MKAIVYTSHGSPEVLSFSETIKPVPRNNEVLIRVRAVSLNALDSHMMRGFPLITAITNTLPTSQVSIPGIDLAGYVEGTGNAVKNIKIGDEVFGTAKNACAEFVSAKETNIVLKPAAVTFESAAAVPVAAITALQALRDYGKIKAGQQVLIYGAGGGVGTFSVQLAKSFGAEVTAVCGTQNLEMVRTLGADHIIDYTQQKFPVLGKLYDLIIAVNGYHPISTYRKVLARSGTFVLAGASKEHIIKAMFQVMLLGPLLSLLGNQRFRFFIAKVNQDDLLYLKNLLENGKLTPVIGQQFSLSRTADAIRCLETRHARGKIIVTVPD